jgi:rubrerythrin
MLAPIDPARQSTRRIPWVPFSRGTRAFRRARHVPEIRMIDDIPRGAGSPLEIGSFEDWHAASSRREFLRLVGLGGAIALLPGFAIACGSDAVTGPSNDVPASGNPLLIDFAQGDVAILQFALVLEQLEAEFYSRVVSAFSTSNIAASEQAVLTEIRNHELAHREFLTATLGGDAGFTSTATFRGLNFSDRTTVLAAAKLLEDLGVAAYNGLAQYLTGTDNLLALAKIVSVEARHASTIRDLIEPRTTAFAPKAADEVFRPAKVAATVQTNLVDKLGFANAPSTFIQGPNLGG